MKPKGKKRSAKSGLPPGTLVHIGTESDRELTVKVLSYSETGCDERSITLLSECVTIAGDALVTWIDVDGLHDIDVIRRIGDCRGLHPLVLEDILNTHQRPKVEDFGDYLYIVLKMLYLRDGQLISEQLSLILGDKVVISFQEGISGDPFASVRERLRNGRSRIREMGADYLIYSLMDVVIDNYFVVLELLGEKIETLEESVLADLTTDTVRQIHRLKRDTLNLRKAVWPLREVIGALERRESHLISEPVIVYLRDLYDHAIQVIDSIETNRDMLAGLLDVYLSSVNNRMNAVMKVLTVIATLFMPLTFIVGLYGMNFKYMPELEWRWGYPAVLLLMALISLGMIVSIRRKRWL